MDYLYQEEGDSGGSRYVVNHKISVPPTFVCVTEVHDKVDRPLGIREESRQLDVCTPLTPDSGHLGCR